MRLLFRRSSATSTRCVPRDTSLRWTPIRSCRAVRRVRSSRRWRIRSIEPRFDVDTNRVIGGYGILQPRVGVSLSSTQRSLYARLHGGDAGIDPYTRAVSDTYQDAFREGSFIGKGIYDVDAFERALRGRLPDNAILSHDLLEGCYARSGLLSDVELIEDYPSTYRSDVRRRHRWIRGDWQIADWITPRVPDREAAGVQIRYRFCRGGKYSTTCAAVSCRRR